MGLDVEDGVGCGCEEDALVFAEAGYVDCKDDGRQYGVFLDLPLLLIFL